MLNAIFNSVKTTMKINIVICSLLISMCVVADVGIHFNNQGEFIPPDVYLQSRGLKQYQNGAVNDAMATLKGSAQFGNDLSKYIVAMIYFEKKDWVTGYTWLNLVDKPVEDRDILLKKFNSQLTKKELELSQAKLVELKKQYNDLVSLQRRDKWERSIVATGTRISGIKAYVNRNINIGIGGVPVSSYKLSRQILNYVHEIEPEGIIIMGEIKEKSD